MTALCLCRPWRGRIPQPDSPRDIQKYHDVSINVSSMTYEVFLKKEDLQLEESIENRNPDAVCRETKVLQPPRIWEQLCKHGGEPTSSLGMSCVGDWACTAFEVLHLAGSNLLQTAIFLLRGNKLAAECKEHFLNKR